MEEGIPLKKINKNSIRLQLIRAQLILVVLFVVIQLFVNSIFANTIFLQFRKHDIKEYSENIVHVYDKKGYAGVEEILINRERLREADVSVYDKKTKKYVSSTHSYGRLENDHHVEMMEPDSWPPPQKSNYGKFKTVDEIKEDNGKIIYYTEELGDEYCFIVSMKYASIDEIISIINMYLIMLFLFTSLIVVLVSIRQSRRFVAPIEKLNDSAKEIIRSDYTTEFQTLHQENELGELSQSLQTMTQSMQDKIKQLRTLKQSLEEELSYRVAIDEKRKSFITNASHELKTPITIIAGYTALMKQRFEALDGSESAEKLQELAYETTETILEETDVLLSLVDELLKASRIENDQIILHKESIQIQDFLEGVLDRFQVFMEEKHITLEKDILNLSLRVDIEQFEIALKNVIENAVKHVDENGTILVKVYETAHYIYLDVENTGSVISEEAQTKIFDLFYTSDTSHSKKIVEGSGIGLYLSKNIIEAHQGVITLENIHQGVRCRIRLTKKEA